MGLKCGIIGITNSGKTTLFNCMSNTKAQVTNFAFSTGKSNIGICNVPDQRLFEIDKIVKGVCIYWIVFVSVAWITFWIKDSVPDTLIQCGLGGGAVELFISGAIEIFRDIRLGKDES